MRHLLGIAAILSCAVLSTFDTFLSGMLTNVAYWGIVISILYMVMSAMSSGDSSEA